jgi:hypothetical protein
MEENTTNDTPAEPPPSPAPDVAPPVETEPAKPDETTPAGTKPDEAKPDEAKTPDEPSTTAGPSLAERLGSPASRLRTMQGGPVVGLAAAGFVLLVVAMLLALMVFAPAIAPFRLGSSKIGYRAERDVAIEQVAVRFAHNFLTFDYRTIDANLNQLSKDSTGNFSAQLVRVRKQKDLMDTLRTHKATSRGTVRGETVESVHGDTATIRVFLAQTVTNSTSSTPSTTYKDVLLTLVRTPQGWKVDNVA